MPGDASAPPAEMLSLLFIHLQGTTVGPIATLRTRRTGTRVGSPKKQGAEVMLDEVAVLKDSSEVLSFREVEIERLNGDTVLADRLEKQLRQAGASDHDGRPKIPVPWISPLRRRSSPSPLRSLDPALLGTPTGRRWRRIAEASCLRSPCKLAEACRRRKLPRNS